MVLAIPYNYYIDIHVLLELVSLILLPERCSGISVAVAMMDF